MINIRTVRALENNGGFTLSHGHKIVYKTGWQVATSGETATTPEGCMALIKKFNGNCGVWLENGIYYVDEGKRVSTKKEALSIGRAHNQISVYGWATGRLAYC